MAEHLFIHCKALKLPRDNLRLKCKKLNIGYTLRTLFTHKRIKLEVEKYLFKIMQNS